MTCNAPRSFALLGILFVGCAHKTDHTQPLPNDAYIWQRRWSASLIDALHESSSEICTWRILAAEIDSHGKSLSMAVDREVLRRQGQPVIAVIRINPHAPLPATPELLTLISTWQQAGVPVRGIEIDYDSETSGVARYRDFLHTLRRQLSTGMQLSITALPTWLESPELSSLLSQVDESVLQVHSVMSPRKGLFDPTTADAWIRKWSAKSGTPFRVALPTYWSRVTWNAAGHVVAIESETPRYGTDAVSQELFVDPSAVSSFVAALRKNSPPHLAGLAWFRLPTVDDERSWNTTTWHAVMHGQPVLQALPVVRIKSQITGVIDISLANTTTVASRFPSQISISPSQGCEFADAMSPYSLDRQKDAWRFRLNQQELLHAGQEKLVGWVRCAGQEVQAHASF
jgi:hypothetical protein